MKKYKNSACIIGETHYLEAFSKDLKKIGYIIGDEVSFLKNVIIVNPINGYKKYNYYRTINPNYKSFDLPEDWNSALEYVSELEEVKLEFEAGDYFRYYSGIYKISKITECSVFIDNGQKEKDLKFTSVKEFNNDKSIIKLTLQEIEFHLLEQAEKEGFVNGANIKYDNKEFTIRKMKLFDNKEDCNSQSNIEYSKKEKYFLCVMPSFGCFPLPKCSLIPSHPEIKVIADDKEYTAKFEDWGISFNDCAKFDKSDFIKLDLFFKRSNRGETNRLITSIKWGKADFTIEQIKQIAEHYGKEKNS